MPWWKLNIVLVLAGTLLGFLLCEIGIRAGGATPGVPARFWQLRDRQGKLESSGTSSSGRTDRSEAVRGLFP